MKTKDVKRIEAETRQENWASLSAQQKLDALDKRLGVGRGAVEQREKLYEQRDAEKAKAAADLAAKQKPKSKKQKVAA
jgi:hypothetical protein